MSVETTIQKLEVRLIVETWKEANNALSSIPDNVHCVVYTKSSSRFQFFGCSKPAIFSEDPVQESKTYALEDGITCVMPLPYGFTITESLVLEIEKLLSLGHDRIDIDEFSIVHGKLKSHDFPLLGLTVYARQAFADLRAKNPVRAAECVHVNSSVIYGDAFGWGRAASGKNEEVKKVFHSSHPWTKEIDPSSCVDLGLLNAGSSFGFEDKDFVQIQNLPNATQEECELAVRDARCHWIVIPKSDDLSTVNWNLARKSTIGRSDRWILSFPQFSLVNPKFVRMMPPMISDGNQWSKHACSLFHTSFFDADYSPIGSQNKPNSKKSCDLIFSHKKIKVAVLSMCGVSGDQDKFGVAADRYGLGGEHQVVHWLRESFLSRPEVELCDIFDTANHELAPGEFYDLVLSNSCWKSPPKVAKNGLSIFWHFNSNAEKSGVTPLDNANSIRLLGYDCVWSNSPSTLKELSKFQVEAYLKHLNGSNSCHTPYPWESKLFHHQSCYVGGYQTEYKGIELLRNYVRKMCLDERVEFVIYGNSKWKLDVQKRALQTDKGYFEQSHIEPAYEPHYKGILHPQDFRILAKNCKIWVNFNSADQRPLGMVNDRPIWAMNAGAFVITDDSVEQRLLYGETCDYSNGGDHLVERSLYWLNHEEERLQKGQLAHQNMMNLGLHTDGTVESALKLYAQKRTP